MPSDARDKGYLFGCCAACRAPFVPKDTRLFGYKETQTVYYLVSRFKSISDRERTRSDFSDSRVKGHIITVQHAGAAHLFVREMGPAADLDRGLAGWDPDIDRCTYPDTCFRMQTGAKRVRPDGNNGGLEFGPDSLDAVRQARDRVEAEGVADPAEVDLAILRSLANSPNTVYRAVWDAPDLGVRHADLAAWLDATDIRPYAIDLSFTLSICSLCNHIWDTFARLSHTLRSDSIIPLRAITIKNGKTKMKLPQVHAADQSYQRRLGCMAGYYVHGSLKNIKAGLSPANYGRVEGDKRQTAAALAWLALHVHCMYQEMGGRASGAEATKGVHNYLGCLDLMISYYLFLCATVDPAHAFSGAVPFERFHVFYVKELSECPAPAWDPSHRRLHDFVFDAGYKGLTTEGGRIDRVSTRLVQLYTERVSPLLEFVLGTPGRSPVELAAEGFFLTHAEADELVEDHLPRAADNIDSIKVHLERAGAGAVLWQLQRGMREESDKFQKELGLWMKKRMQQEWKNISSNQTPKITLRESQLIYLLMHTRDAVAGMPALPGTADSALALASSALDDPAPVLDAMRAAGRCSMWKAAQRLRAWKFTQEVPDVPEVLDDESGGSDDSDGGGGAWRWLGPASRLRRPRMPALAESADQKRLVSAMAGLRLSKACRP